MYPINEDTMLPAEIWEKVLLNLFRSSPKSFLSAAKTNAQWRHLAIRICRKLCLNKLQKSLLFELFKTQAIHQRIVRKSQIENGCYDAIQDEDWLQVFNLYQETQLQPTTSLPFIHSYKNTSSYAIDPFLLLATYEHSRDSERVESTSIRIYSALDFPLLEEIDDGRQCSVLSERLSREFATVDLKEEIYNIHFLFLPSPVMLVRSKETDFLRCVFLDKGCRLSKKDMVCVSPRIQNSFSISTEGKFVLTITDTNNGSHVLYEAHRDDGNNNTAGLSLTVLYSFSTGFPLFMSKLLDGHVKTTSRNGHIYIFKIPTSDQRFKFYQMKPVTEIQHQSDLNLRQRNNSSRNVNGESYCSSNNAEESQCSSNDDRLRCKLIQPVASSTFSKDLRYPNQTLFFQDWTFTSTAVSSSLLYYWHMDRGREYSWLVGSTSAVLTLSTEYENPSDASYHLNNVIIGGDVGLEVTAIQVSRGILICGTSDGRLLTYKLLEEFQNNGNDLTFLRRAPSMNIPLISGKIVSITVLWTSLGLLTVVLDVNKCSTMNLLPLKMS